MRLILTILVISFMFFSCKEESTQPVTNFGTKIFPLKTGNYWIYKFYRLDASFNTIDSTIALDSLVITSSSLYLNRTAYFLDLFRDNILTGNYVFSPDVYGIYRMNDSNSEKFPDVKTGWMKIFDNQNETWSIYGGYHDNIPFVFNDYETTCNRQIAINGSKNTTQEVIIVNGKNINSIAAVYKSDRKISFNYYEPGYPKLANVDSIELRYERFWFGDSVGIVKWQYDPYKSNVRSDSTFCKYNKSPKVTNFTGWKRELLRYKLN